MMFDLKRSTSISSTLTAAILLVLVVPVVSAQVKSPVKRTRDVAMVLPADAVWLEAEVHVTDEGQVSGEETATCFASSYAEPKLGKYHVFVSAAIGRQGPLHVWARVRGRGIAIKRKNPDGKSGDHWRWPKAANWRWISMGQFTGGQTLRFAGSADEKNTIHLDAVVVTADAAWQPREMCRNGSALLVDFNNKLGPVPRYLASANINSPKAMLIDREDWHDAVKALGFRMIRFQAPESKWDYRKRSEWDDAKFATMDAAITVARKRWGVDQIMLGMHRVSLPLQDDKLIESEFQAYADALAMFAQRYAAPGHVRVEYWEPFNELDHAGFLKKLEAHRQSYEHVAKLYAVCSQTLKAVNPAIKVGGPAAMWPGGWETKMMLEAPGAIADFVSWHQYPTGKASTPDEQILASVLGPKGIVDGLKRMQAVVRECRPGQPIEMLMTEFHINHSIWSPVDTRGASEFTAVFAASVMLNMGQAGADATMIHDVLAANYGLVGRVSKDGVSRRLGRIRRMLGNDPIHVRPVGWVYRWFNEFVGGSWRQCEWVMQPAGFAESPRAPVIEAAATADEGRRTVLLVNRDVDSHDVLLLGLDDGPAARAAFSLPVLVHTVDTSGARIARAPAPTANGRWPWRLTPMSVTIVVFSVDER